MNNSTTNVLFEELRMAKFTHAWLHFPTSGKVYTGRITACHFLGNQLTLTLSEVREVIEVEANIYGTKKWVSLTRFAEYSFQELASLDGPENVCEKVAARSGPNTSVFIFRTGDQVVLTCDPEKVNTIENIITKNNSL